eukprot:TRINITY_DN5125_c0_g1_i2.p1 TRINITY_DN5125_c0_g1~~TRINITY_DN5125_c0_g1_i2.p1  ORF type:complete len:202 (+),score=36.37 TRINITY_DN5125_c0_g1_i2:57-662(+)
MHMDAPNEDGFLAIEITFGTTERTSRVDLKKRMSSFGEVEVCHMGARGQDYPFIRFKEQASAEAALSALKSGKVFMEDGSLLAGRIKSGNQRRREAAAPQHQLEGAKHLTSRSLILEQKRSRKASRSKSRTRRRSRSRSRKRSREKDSKRGETEKSRSSSRSSSSSSSSSDDDNALQEPPLPPSEICFANPLFGRKRKVVE